MSGRSKRRHGDSAIVDVADVFADDALIDALVSERGEAVSTGIGVQGGARGINAKGIGGRGGDPLIELFDIWRDEISSTPLPTLPAVPRASPAVAAGRHRPQRTVRPALFIAAAICALLIGSAAVGSRTAKPGDALWPLASVLWSDRLDSVHSLHEVNDALAEVQDALAAGRPDDAREALMRATVQLGHVDDLDMPASMPEKVQQLWADVIPDAERRSTQAAASVAAASADPTTAPPVGSPSSTAVAAGTPSASTPLLGTVLGAISASAQQPASTYASSTPSDGPSVPVAAAGLPTIAYPSATKAVINSSTDALTAPTTDAPPKPVSTPTPTPPPVTTEPAPNPSAAVPVVPTSGSTSSGEPTSTENSAPTPPPPSTEPDPAHVSSVDTSTPAG